MLPVAVLGAGGRLGSQLCRGIAAAPDLQLVSAVSGRDALAPLLGNGVRVVVDVTHPDVVMDHIRFAVEHSINVVVGTSGMDAERLTTVRDWLAATPSAGVIVVPNFAIGAVLAARFARQAAAFFDSVEIIELHHAGKADAPSGTANATAQAIARARREADRGPVPDATTIAAPGARGADVDGIHVHSVRLPGLVASQEVLLGSTGEILTIRHDSLDRASFVAGALLAIRGVERRPGLTLGLEPLLGLT